MRMYDCPKFSKCSAPLCPLDPDWKKRSMTKDERVCFYLREAVKDGAQERFQGGIAEEIYLQAVDLLPEMLAHSGALQKRLQRSQATGSKCDRGFLKPEREAITQPHPIPTLAMALTFTQSPNLGRYGATTL